MNAYSKPNTILEQTKDFKNSDYIMFQIVITKVRQKKKVTIVLRREHRGSKSIGTKTVHQVQTTES